MRKPRLREEKRLAEDHTASAWQSLPDCKGQVPSLVLDVRSPSSHSQRVGWGQLVSHTGPTSSPPGPQGGRASACCWARPGPLGLDRGEQVCLRLHQALIPTPCPHSWKREGGSPSMGAAGRDTTCPPAGVRGSLAGLQPRPWQKNWHLRPLYLHKGRLVGDGNTDSFWVEVGTSPEDLSLPPELRPLHPEVPWIQELLSVSKWTAPGPELQDRGGGASPHFRGSAAPRPSSPGQKGGNFSSCQGASTACHRAWHTRPGLRAGPPLMERPSTDPLAWALRTIGGTQGQVLWTF